MLNSGPNNILIGLHCKLKVKFGVMIFLKNYAYIFNEKVLMEVKYNYFVYLMHFTKLVV